MSPANTFRQILKMYFGAKPEPLPNTSYFKLAAEPYVFYPLTFRDDM